MRRNGLASQIKIVPGPHGDLVRAGIVAQLVEGADRPTGVVASDDICAVELLDALRSTKMSVPRTCRWWATTAVRCLGCPTSI